MRRTSALPWIALIAVYFLWGSTYLGIRVAVETIPPYLMTGVRYFIAGILLFALQWAFAKEKPALPTNEIVQEFPVAGPMQTAWKIQYVANNPGPGLTITGAWFKTTPTDDWLKVIGNIRLSEIFVPYNNGTRIFRHRRCASAGSCR